MPLLLILLGAGIRLRQWWGGRSLWLDEALIARSLVSRDYVELVAEPLQGDQAAPVLWLWATRLSLDLLGDGERSLRLVGLLAGLATLVLAWRLARRLLPDVVVPVAVAVVALSPSLVYFSNEVKPYALDAAVVLALVLLGLRARSGVTALAVAGVVAVWASYAAVFALAGLSVVLVLDRLHREGVRAAVRAAGLLSGWLVSLGVAYVLVLHRHRDSQVLSRYWADTFPAGADDVPAWLLRRAAGLVDDPLELVLWPLSLLLLALGTWRLLRSQPVVAALALSPVPFAALAGALGAYPFAGRLALWLVPVAAIALAAVLSAPGRQRWIAVVAVAAVAGSMAWRTLPLTVEVQERNELRPVLEQLSQQRQPGDLVLVDNAAQAPFAFYAGAGVERDGVVLLASPEDVGGSCNDAVALRTGRFATQRVWVVFAHELTDGARLGTRRDLIARIEDVSNVAATIERTGAMAVLFDPTAPAAPGRTEPRNPERCLSVVRTG